MPGTGRKGQAASAEKGKAAYVQHGCWQCSNEDLADIHAYLQSIPKPLDAKNIPLLNQ
jgi:cytochrome c551/c552